MKTKTLIVVLLLLPALSYGQVGRFIKNAASKAASTINNAAEKEANRRADSIAQANADKAAKQIGQSIQDSIQKNSTQGQTTTKQGEQPQGGLDLGKLMGGKVDLKYKDEYLFTSRLYMQAESYDNKDVMKIDMYMFFSANSPDVGMETKTIADEKGNTSPAGSSMVMDAGNKCFIILTDMGGTKMGVISAIPDENSVQNQTDGKSAQKTKPPVYTKTGNTKVIAGYKCDEYSYKDSDQKITGKVWFTKDADLKIDKRGWSQTGMSAYYGYAGFEGGLIMGNESYDANGKLKSKSETKEISKSFPHTITVKGYSLMQMNQKQEEKKK